MIKTAARPPASRLACQLFITFGNVQHHAFGFLIADLSRHRARFLRSLSPMLGGCDGCARVWHYAASRSQSSSTLIILRNYLNAGLQRCIHRSPTSRSPRRSSARTPSRLGVSHFQETICSLKVEAILCTRTVLRVSWRKTRDGSSWRIARSTILVSRTGKSIDPSLLLFVHGCGTDVNWWSFIAPYLARYFLMAGAPPHSIRGLMPRWRRASGRRASGTAPSRSPKRR